MKIPRVALIIGGILILGCVLPVICVIGFMVISKIGPHTPTTTNTSPSTNVPSKFQTEYVSGIGYMPLQSSTEGPLKGSYLIVTDYLNQQVRKGVIDKQFEYASILQPEITELPDKSKVWKITSFFIYPSMPKEDLLTQGKIVCYIRVTPDSTKPSDGYLGEIISVREFNLAFYMENGLEPLDLMPKSELGLEE